MWLPQSFIAVLFAVLAQGALTNTTIDDTTFTFGGTWTALSTKSPYTSTPTPCPPQPDPSQTFGETWHVGTIHPGAPPSAAWGSFSFKGSSHNLRALDSEPRPHIVRRICCLYFRNRPGRTSGDRFRIRPDQQPRHSQAPIHGHTAVCVRCAVLLCNRTLGPTAYGILGAEGHRQCSSIRTV